MKKRITVFVCSSLMSGVFALDVSDATFISYSTNVAKLAAAAITADYDLPAEAGTPSFHFDAKRTNETGNAWTFLNGTVTCIPSLSNNRYLTADFSEATWKGWSASDTPLAPTWVYDSDIGANVVDFGEVASKQAMTFDAWTPDMAVAPTNYLANIGTVFAVVKNRGGWLMGGDVGAARSARYAWHRGYSGITSSKNPSKVDSPMVRGDTAADIRNGNFRLNGVPIEDAARCGFSGGWDYLTLRTADAKIGALGIGIGDARNVAQDNVNMKNRSGGIAFAELIVYPDILSDEMCRRIEDILSRKWFGVYTRGYGSFASAGEVRVACTTSDTKWHEGPPDDGTGGMLGIAEVADGRTLAISKIRGGRGAAATFEKVGSGRLELGDASELGGKIVVSEGTLAFSRRIIPSDFSVEPALRFDASAPGAITVVDGYVTKWRNDGSETPNGQTCYAGAENDAVCPRLILDAVNGKPAVDFGSYGIEGGCVLHIMTNGNQNTQIEYPATYVAVLSAEKGGGCVLGTDKRFLRTDDPGVFWKPIHEYSIYWTAWMNGIKIDYPTSGYLTPDYQVTAVRAANAPVTCIGGSVLDSQNVRGGLKLCELVVWKVPLTERQIEDAQAFLAWKWLGRVLPGYAISQENDSFQTDRPDVSHLVANGGAVEIANGASLKVAKISGKVLTKTGEGQLGVTSGSLPNRVIVQGGCVKQLPSPEPTGACVLADDAVFHVAADEIATLDTVLEGGTNFLERWHDLSAARNVAWYPGSKTAGCRRPWISEDTLNGLPTIDFGETGDGGSTLSLARSIDNARSIYVVYKALRTSDYAVLGTSGETSLDAGGSTHSFYSDFLSGSNSRLLYGWNNAHVTSGDIFMDGNKVAYNANVGSGYHLVEFHTRAGAHVSSIARDRNMMRNGGVRIAEVLIYDRELTAPERTATRNYLLDKWFPSVQQQELPAIDSTVSGVVMLSLEGDCSLDTDGVLKVRDLVGCPKGTVVKNGMGELEVASASCFTGKVSVISGTLKLKGVDSSHEYEAPVLDGRIAHFDACENLACDSLGCITNWSSKVGEIRALPFFVDSNKPYVKPDSNLYGLPSVVMPLYGSLRFADSNGSWAVLQGVKSVFWVIGSQEGGGFVLSGASGTSNFHRYYTQGDSPVGSIPERAIISSAYAGGDIANTSKCIWRLNGETIAATSRGFTGAWDVLSMNLRSDDYTVPDIGGFAADARAYPESGVLHNRMGNQRLCEVIFYNRVLTNDEVAKNEAYLNAKWGINPAHVMRRNWLEVDLSGGLLDCDGGMQYVAGLSGSGSVVNGDLTIGDRWTISLDKTGATVVRATGTMAFENGVSVQIENADALPKAMYTSWLTVAIAAKVEGIEALNVAQKEISGFNGSANARFRFCDGALQLRLQAKGVVISLR